MESSQTIIAQLRKEAAAGELSFARFMRLALFSGAGYYMSKVNIGMKNGDFYTASNFPLFGMTLAKYIGDKWIHFGRPKVLQIVELGGGEGQLARAILNRLPDQVMADTQIHYCFLDPSLRLHEMQQHVADSFQSNGKLSFSFGQVHPEDATVLIANEVLDALPVERIRKIQTSYEQSFIEYRDNQPVEVWKPATKNLVELAEKWLPLPNGSIGEICPDLVDFITGLGSQITKVAGIFIDYGITTDEVAAGVRPEGTIRGYSGHQIVSPLENPGNIDITADVNWDYTVDVLQKHGFSTYELVSQGSFLMKHGIIDLLTELAPGMNPNPQWTSQFKQLVYPGGMGERFSVLEFETAQD